MADEPTPKRNVGRLRRRLAAKRKPLAEPVPVTEAIRDANAVAKKHIADGTKDRQRRNRRPRRGIK